MTEIFNLHHFGVPGMVARLVARKEAEEAGQDGECMKAFKAEWDKLHEKRVFDLSSARSWKKAAGCARRNGPTEHVGRARGIMVEMIYELAKGDPHFKYKYRVVFREAAYTQQTGKRHASKTPDRVLAQRKRESCGLLQLVRRERKTTGEC